MSQPPVFQKIKAREMPDFSKTAFKPMLGQIEPTVPSSFDLASEIRHQQAMEQQKTKLMQMEKEEQEKRNFKAKELPDFEAPKIMPSQKPITVAIQPAFASN